MKNATRPYYLNQTEFVGVLNNALFPNKNFSEITFLGVATAIQTVPTGFSSVPPPGPAMPDAEIE